MIAHRFLCPVTTLLLLAVGSTVAAAAEPPAADPQQVAQDPDFALQGEYADTTRGLQAIATGDGTFQVVIYTDGLPAPAGTVRTSKHSRWTPMN